MYLIVSKLVIFYFYISHLLNFYTTNIVSFYIKYILWNNILQICELTFQVHPSLFLISFSCLFLFLKLKSTSNLRSSLSSTIIYFSLDANSNCPLLIFLIKKKKFPLCVNSSKLIEYIITTYPFVVVVYL